MKNLIDNGCKVYEITDRLLHMKTYMVDENHFTIGMMLIECEAGGTAMELAVKQS